MRYQAATPAPATGSSAGARRTQASPLPAAVGEPLEAARGAPPTPALPPPPLAMPPPPPPLLATPWPPLLPLLTLDRAEVVTVAAV
ncbi:unnamed protein product [Closterium sp. NIES-53]